jgi:D-arabinono-1,4-lactone oxidase
MEAIKMVAAKAFNPPTSATWVKIYSYITIGAALYGIAWAHVPFIIGKPWTTCDGGGSVLGCVLTFHLFEVPAVLFNLFVACYGLKRFSPETARAYCSLLTFAATFNFVFFAFEVNTLFGSLQRLAPRRETLALTSIAMILLGGTALGVLVVHRLITAYSDKRI